MSWILRYSARRRFNMVDILANVSLWVLMYSNDYGAAYGIFAWIALSIASITLEDTFFPEYRKSPTPSTPPKTGV